MSYPKPSPMGGTIIRAVIQNFKKNSFKLPITKPTLIACSGGVDSMVLAHLIARYGRKLIDPKLITLLHFDHGWRKESATLERDAVKKLANDLGVQFLSVDLKPPKKETQNNWEKDARTKRNQEYARLTAAKAPYRFVLTAHHQDDVIETLLWRFFRGEFLHQRQGILFQDNHVLRPFLQVSKEQIRAYAEQEAVPFHEDPTNQDPTQMRAALRTQIIPTLEKSFPGLKRSLVTYVNAPLHSFKK